MAEAPLSPSPVTESDTYTGDDSPTPVSDSEDEPVPRAPQADSRRLAPIAEGPGGDDAQAAAEQRVAEWEPNWWHRQYEEEHPLPYEPAYEPEEEYDPYHDPATWYWSYELGRYDWNDPTGDRRKGNFYPGTKVRMPRKRGGQRVGFFTGKYGKSS